MMAHDTGKVRKLLYPGIQFVGFISSLPEQFRNNTNRLTVVILSAILLFADMEYTGATPPEVEWNRTFGGAGIERTEFVKQTPLMTVISLPEVHVCAENVLRMSGS